MAERIWTETDAELDKELHEITDEIRRRVSMREKFHIDEMMNCITNDHMAGKITRINRTPIRTAPGALSGAVIGYVIYTDRKV
jgi:hypothetical protein